MLLNAILYVYSDSILEERANSSLFHQADEIKRFMVLSFETANNDLDFLSLINNISSYFLYSKLDLIDNAEDIRWKAEVSFYKIANESKYLNTIRLIGVDGKSIIDIINNQISYKHFDFSNQVWFIKAMDSINNNISIEYTPSYDGETIPTIVICKPCVDNVGHKYGFVCIFSIIQNLFIEAFKKAVISQKSYLYVVDQNGMVVTCKNKDILGMRLNMESTRQLLAGNTGIITEKDETGPDLMKKVYLPLGIADLGLVVALPMGEITAFGRRLQSFNLLFAVLSVLLSCAIVYAATKRLARPIVALRDAALEIAQGRFGKQTRVNSSDEVGQLATAFNQMSSSLAENSVKLLRELEERRKAEQALKNLILNAPIGMYVIQAGKFELANPGFERITGYGQTELHDTDCLKLVVPEQREFVRNSAVQMLKGKSSTPYEFQILHKDGGHRWVVESVTSIQYEGMMATLGYFMDVTEHKQLEDRFYQAQKMEAIGRLAGGVAHDFNNMLSAVSGYAELLLSVLDKGRPPHRYGGEILKAAEWGASLTRRLLAFSRKQDVQPQDISVNSVFTGMESMLRRLIGEDIILTTALDPDLGHVKADPGHIEQVILNLALNARDAMPDGGRLTIETANVYLDEASAQSHGDVTPGSFVMLSVSDDGIGMDAGTRSRIFEPFFTTKGVGKGTGIGLATVYGIVKQSGGHILVFSEAGHGTTFRIYLPRLGDSETAAQSPEALRDSPQGCETVLLVEDDDTVRSMVTDMLTGHGYRLLEARNGREALAMFLDNKDAIDLVVTDIVMPEMKGNELGKHLNSLVPNVKILYMSGNSEKSLVAEVESDMSVDFIHKPFRVNDLLQRVRSLLDLHART
jgi:PAS domain S-box-containing protein